MKATNIPTLQPVPFATNAASGNKRTIPATQPAGSPGYASYSTGFPPETMQPIAAGGTPPYGQDFNGLFFDVTNELRWAQAGGTYTYDATFSTAIGGYPAGAVLKSASTNVLWISTVDDNTTDPDSSGASGWIAFRSNSGRAALAVVAGDITPSKVQLGSSLISITGDATGLTSTLRLPLTAGASYLVNNATTGSGATLNVQGSTGTGVTIAQGQASVVFCDGTNYYSAGSSGAGQYLPINGTAVAATKLATARAFNLTGTVTSGSQNFDGTANVTLTTSIADGALSIAKTNGLQPALDGKLSLGGGTLTGALATVGVSFGSVVVSSYSDLSKHLNLYGNIVGLSVTAGHLNYVVNSTSNHDWYNGANHSMTLDQNGNLTVLNAITSGSNVTVNGNLTVTGTSNVQGSDVRLKKNVRRSKARPMHRRISLYDYDLIRDGSRGRGTLAQELLIVAKEYVQEFDFNDRGRTVRRLGVDYSRAAFEMSKWASDEVDQINKRFKWVVVLVAVLVAADVISRVL